MPEFFSRANFFHADQWNSSNKTQIRHGSTANWSCSMESPGLRKNTQISVLLQWTLVTITPANAKAKSKCSASRASTALPSPSQPGTFQPTKALSAGHVSAYTWLSTCFLTLKWIARVPALGASCSLPGPLTHTPHGKHAQLARLTSYVTCLSSILQATFPLHSVKLAPVSSQFHNTWTTHQANKTSESNTVASGLTKGVHLWNKQIKQWKSRVAQKIQNIWSQLL